MNEIGYPTAIASSGETVDTLHGLSRISMFWRPHYLADSAWLQHLPFAFWLVDAQRPRSIVELGTHYGVSYFAFCQAVRQLGLDAVCYAVDTWKGDEHAGFYGEEVFAAVRAHNETHYSDFSTLVRSSFDDALGHFADGSIDVLHIDGHHTYESVRHDFESWRPKLSTEAIVLFHDTNVRERGFGVFRFFEDLKKHHPHFEFVHGHGLGVMGFGERWTDPVTRLFEAENDRLARHALHEAFSRLGLACSDAFALRTGREQRKLIDAKLAQARRQIEAASGQLLNEQNANVALKQDLESQRLKIDQLELSVAERFHELAVATRLLARKEAEANTLAKKLDSIRRKSMRRRLKKMSRRVFKIVTGKIHRK